MLFPGRIWMEITLERVTKSYGAIVALRDTSLSIRSGERIVVLGPSGGGKTTLLRLIAGLESPSTGSVVVGHRRNSNARDLGHDVAMVFQNLALFPHLTAEQNIGLGLKIRR